jgi:hypothetical protein
MSIPFQGSCKELQVLVILGKVRDIATLGNVCHNLMSGKGRQIRFLGNVHKNETSRYVRHIVSSISDCGNARMRECFSHCDVGKCSSPCQKGQSSSHNDVWS